MDLFCFSQTTRRWRVHGYPNQCEFCRKPIIERYNPGDQFHIMGSPVASSMTGLSNDLSGPSGNGQPEVMAQR